MSSTPRSHCIISANRQSRFPPSLHSSSCPIYNPHFSIKQTSALLSDSTKPQLIRYLRRNGRGSRASYSKRELHKRAMMLAVCQWRADRVALTRESFLGKSEGCGCNRGEIVGPQAKTSSREEKSVNVEAGAEQMEAGPVKWRDAHVGSNIFESEMNGIEKYEKQNDESSSTFAEINCSDTFTEQFQASIPIPTSSPLSTDQYDSKYGIAEDDIISKAGETPREDDDYIDISFEATVEICHKLIEATEQDVRQPGASGSNQTVSTIHEDWIEVSSNPQSSESLHAMNNTDQITALERNCGYNIGIPLNLFAALKTANNSILDDYIITTFNEWIGSVEVSATAEPDLTCTSSTTQNVGSPSADSIRGSLYVGICKDCEGALDAVICLDDYDDDSKDYMQHANILPPPSPAKYEVTAEETNKENKWREGEMTLNTTDPNLDTDTSKPQSEVTIEADEASVGATLIASISINDCIYPGAFPQDSKPENDVMAPRI